MKNATVRNGSLPASRQLTTWAAGFGQKQTLVVDVKVASAAHFMFRFGRSSV